MTDQRWAGIGTLVPASRPNHEPIHRPNSQPDIERISHEGVAPAGWRPNRLADAIRTGGVAVRRRRLPVIALSAIIVFVVILAVPTVDTPTRIVALAFATTSVVAGLVPLVRLLRGRLSEADPASQVRKRLGVVSVNARDTEPTVALALMDVASILREPRRVLVVQLTDPNRCDLSLDLDHAYDLVGSPRERVDITRGSEFGDESSSGPSIVGLRTPILDLRNVTALADRRSPTVLVIDTATARWSELLRAQRLLKAIGSEVSAVVIWCGRIPVDPSHSWDPTSVSSSEP